MNYDMYYPKLITIKRNNHIFKIDECLKDQYDIVEKKAIANNWDAPIINCGIEGTGKTTLSFQAAIYFDPNFTLKNVVFTPEQFMEAIQTLPEGSSIVWDEAITGAMSQQANAVSLTVIQKMTQIRKKRYKLFINFPYLWMLNKYFIYRSLAVIKVIALGFEDRGYFNFYGRRTAKNLVGMMKDKYRTNPDRAFMDRYCKSAFWGYFTSYFPLDEQAYNIKKETAIQDLDKRSPNRWKIFFAKTLRAIKEDSNLTITKLAEKLECSPQHLWRIAKDDNIA